MVREKGFKDMTITYLIVWVLVLNFYFFLNRHRSMKEGAYKGDIWTLLPHSLMKISN